MGYWVKESKKWKGTYAFLTVISTEEGWGYKMVEHIIRMRLIPTDILIWVTKADNTRSVYLAKKLGFTRNLFDRFNAVEQNQMIDQSGFVGAFPSSFVGTYRFI